MVPRLGRFRMLIQDHQIATMKCWSILLENNHEHLYCSSGPVLDTKPVSTLDVPLPMIGLDISPQQDVLTFSKKYHWNLKRWRNLPQAQKEEELIPEFWNSLANFDIRFQVFKLSSLGLLQAISQALFGIVLDKYRQGKKQQCCRFSVGGVGLCCCGWLKRNGWLTRYDIYMQAWWIHGHCSWRWWLNVD